MNECIDSHMGQIHNKLLGLYHLAPHNCMPSHVPTTDCDTSALRSCDLWKSSGSHIRENATARVGVTNFKIRPHRGESRAAALQLLIEAAVHEHAS